MNTLQIRKTNKYVGEYQHLDEWEEIGTFDVRSSTSVNLDDEDVCEPIQTTHVVEVCAEGHDDAEIAKALTHSFAKSGCAHEYDCCGCRSYHVVEVEKVNGLWAVVVESSRNF